jgi:hypothetical protein
MEINIQGLRFGKKPPVRDYRTFLLQNYVRDDIPKPPDSLNALDRVYRNLNQSDPTYLFPMMANDEIGDCTIVGMAHGDTVWSGMIGNLSIYPVELVKKIYFHLTGGDDTGLAMLTVLNYFRKNIVAGERIYAYMGLNPHNRTHVKQAIMLFGGVFLGFQVQEKCLEEFVNRTPWKPGKLLNAGHAVFVTGYDKDGIEVLTWGNTQKATWDWWDWCVDEAYAILPPEAANPDFIPGFNFSKLKEDLVTISEWM